MIKERIGLTDKQAKALNLVATASENAGDFLGTLLEKAKQFDMSELDVENMLQMIPNQLIDMARPLLEEIRQQVNGALAPLKGGEFMDSHRIGGPIPTGENH